MTLTWKFYEENIVHIDIRELDKPIGANIGSKLQISDEFYVGGDLQEISDCLKGDEEKYALKFFMGYSGWSPGQLESEIKEESWVVSHVNVDIFKADQEAAWQESLLRLNDEYFSMWLNFPFNPKSN